jgi:hypothetical protein
MRKSDENAQTNETTLFMSLLPILVCIKKNYLPLYHIESSFSLPLCQQLTQKWDQILEREKNI